MAYGMDAWALDALREDHTVKARAWASVNGSPFVIPLEVRPGGSVKVDGTSAVRRTLSCDVLGSIRSPKLDPFQAEVLVEYGVISGLRESWTKVGTFMLQATNEVRPGVIHLEGRDRWQRIVDARYERPVTTSGSIVNSIRVAIESADQRIPSLVVDAGVTDYSQPSSLWARDRDKQIIEQAKAIGCMVYFRPDGTPVLAPLPAVPDIADPGTWQLDRGDGGAKVISARKLDRGPTYNSAVVEGVATDGSVNVWAVSRDTSGEVTTYGGGFGKKPRFLTSRLITTQLQAQDAADRLRQNVIGRSWSVDTEGLPRPDLEYGDSLRIEVEPGRFQTHGLQAFPIPLGAGTVRYVTRSTAEEVASE